ncbi:MAG: alpha/beta hydrolase [Pirellulales bacterium]
MIVRATWSACLICLLSAGALPADDSNGVDIAYGKHEQQRLDVYRAQNVKATESSPVVIWVHGGGWRNGDKDNRSGSMLCRTWTTVGLVVVNLNYRLTPEVQHPAHIEDVAAGIAWVHQNISKYGGDTGRIFLLGHSAGAHLVALAGTNPRFLEKHELVPNQTLAGIMPIDTASFDLTTTRTLLVRKMIRDAFGDDAKTLEEASPILQAKQHRDTCPAFLIAAAKQRPEAISESEKLRQVLPEAKVIQMDYPNQNQLTAHGLIARDLLDLDNTMTKQLIEFVKSHKVSKSKK